MEYKRITKNPDVQLGVPCIRDTGIAVSVIVSMFIDDISKDKIMESNPKLDKDDIQEAIDYGVKRLRYLISPEQDRRL